MTYNRDLSEDHRRKYFVKKPTYENLVQVYETMLSYKLHITTLEHRNVAPMSPKEAVDASIEIRRLETALRTLGILYAQLVDCHVMSEDQFAAWQYLNGISRVPKIRPFNPKPAPVIRDATGDQEEDPRAEAALEAAIAELKTA